MSLGDSSNPFYDRRPQDLVSGTYKMTTLEAKSRCFDFNVNPFFAPTKNVNDGLRCEKA